MTNVEKAVEFVTDGMTIGLGTGRAAERFLHRLAARIRAGLNVRGVPTSRACEALAVLLGIPLTPLEAGMSLDLAVDGADEVDPQLNLIKGYGRALVREKIVAAAAGRFAVLVGPEGVKDKMVAKLGQRGRLPVEVVPFALGFCQTQFAKRGLPAVPVREHGQIFLTDNGNHILECQIAPIEDPHDLEKSLRSIPGVVGTGLFLGMADVVLVQDGTELAIHTKEGRAT